MVMSDPGAPLASRSGSLLVRAGSGEAGAPIAQVVPASVGWQYLEFVAHRLIPPQSLAFQADGLERVAIVLEGHADLTVGEREIGVVGTRSTVFDGPPPPVLLVAPGQPLTIRAVSTALVVVAAAPAGDVERTAMVGPDEILVESRGTGRTFRRVHHLLGPEAEAGRLIAFEVFTPGGNWSSYPPHKHDTDDPPREVRLEELYFYRFDRPGAFALQRVYSPRAGFDETLVPSDCDVVVVPEGYHLVGVPAGYDCYYLNIMAGARRAWQFTVDPVHRWLMDWQPGSPHAAKRQAI